MWLFRYLAWFLLTGLSTVHCRTINSEINPPQEMSYKKEYSYLLKEQQGVDEFAYTAESISEAPRKVQAFTGLPLTGVIDVERKALFRKKRFGVKDIVESPKASRTRRYILSQGWDKHNITYRVVNGSSSLSRDRVEAVVAKALAMWAPHGGLQFSRLDSGTADIMISFVTGDHGDGTPFKGRGDAYAHAWCPPFWPSKIHFNDDYIWGDDSSDDWGGSDGSIIAPLLFVALHEIGHVLGVGHSDVGDSVVSSAAYMPGLKSLYNDDILAIQALYLKDKKDITVTTNPGTPAAPRSTKADNSV